MPWILVNIVAPARHYFSARGHVTMFKKYSRVLRDALRCRIMTSLAKAYLGVRQTTYAYTLVHDRRAVKGTVIIVASEQGDVFNVNNQLPRRSNKKTRA